jgi:hypothetical protein
MQRRDRAKIGERTRNTRPDETRLVFALLVEDVRPVTNFVFLQLISHRCPYLERLLNRYYGKANQTRHCRRH